MGSENNNLATNIYDTMCSSLSNLASNQTAFHTLLDTGTNFFNIPWCRAIAIKSLFSPAEVINPLILVAINQHNSIAQNLGI